MTEGEGEEISPTSKGWIGATITGHFNDYAARIRSLNPQRDPENQKRLAPLFAKDLRASDDEERRNPFYKAVYLDDVIPEEERERVVGLLKKLADAIEDDPTLLDARKIGEKGDWTAVAEEGAGEEVSIAPEEGRPKSLEAAFTEAGLLGERDRLGRELTPFWEQSIPEDRREGIEELVREQTGKVWGYNNEVYVMIDPSLVGSGRIPIYIYDSKGQDFDRIEEILKELGYVDKRAEHLHVPRSSAYDL